MAKFKYHIKNPNNKKEMKKVRIKPLPIGLMKNDKIVRIESYDERDRKNPFDSEII